MLNSSSSSSSEFSQKTLQIKQDDKFFSRLLSKETSMANPSFRVYYGGVSGAVPFTWEIQPGTPKHKFSDNSVPPLTPPPSYYSTTTPTKKHSRSKLLNTLFLNIKLKISHMSDSSSPSSLSSSTWSSSPSSLSAISVRRSSRRCFLSYGGSSSSSSSLEDVEDGHVYGGGGSPKSVMCFGMNKAEKGSCDGFGAGSGGCTAVIMKRAVLSIVGRGSA